MERKGIMSEKQSMNPSKQPDSTPVNKESIVLTVKQIFGKDAHCLWSTGLYKKSLILKVILYHEDSDYNFIIDASHENSEQERLDFIAKTLVAMYARARTIIVHEMALMAQQNSVQKDMVQHEKDRMAGRLGDKDISR